LPTKQNPRKDNWPDWSPDGKKIVWWHQGPAGNFDVYLMNSDGSAQTNLTSENPGADLNAAWSPDGSEIVVDSSYLTDTGFSEIEVMDATGTVFRQLTHNGRNSTISASSPPTGSGSLGRTTPTGCTRRSTRWKPTTAATS
jgi:Tol biopolymer transport system component